MIVGADRKNFVPSGKFSTTKTGRKLVFLYRARALGGEVESIPSAPAWNRILVVLQPKGLSYQMKEKNRDPRVKCLNDFN